MIESLVTLLISTFAFFGIVFIGFAVLLYNFQNKLLYVPGFIYRFNYSPDSPNRYPNDNNLGLRSPRDIKLNYEDVKIKTSDKTNLHGWLVKVPNPQNFPTIVYFHENAGNIGARLPFIQHLYVLLQVNVLIVAYRGYSYSEGQPSEKGIQKDGIAILDFIFNHPDIDSSNVYVFGRSLGGAVAIYAATNTSHKIKGIILENTFTSIGEMVDIVFPKLSPFKFLVLNNHWKSIEKINSIKVPILFIVGSQDELIPTEHMYRLYQAAKTTKSKEMYEVKDGGHNDTWIKETEIYFQKIKNFLNECDL